jgi:hypothetical protein
MSDTNDYMPNEQKKNLVIALFVIIIFGLIYYYYYNQYEHFRYCQSCGGRCNNPLGKNLRRCSDCTNCIYAQSESRSGCIKGDQHGPLIGNPYRYNRFAYLGDERDRYGTVINKISPSTNTINQPASCKLQTVNNKPVRQSTSQLIY